MQIPYRMAVLLVAGLIACQSPREPLIPGTDLPVEPLQNSRPAAPEIELIAVSEYPGSLKRSLYTQITSRSTDADGDAVSYRYSWSRNGVAQGYPKNQTSAVAEWPYDGIVRFEDESRTEYWTVVVTPRDKYGEGTTAFAQTSVVFEKHCEINPYGEVVYADCTGQNRFTVTSSQAWSPGNSATAFVQNLMAEKLTFAGETTAYSRFRNFLNLATMRVLDAKPESDPDHDAETYRYRPVTAVTGPFSGAESTIGTGGYEAAALLDRTCLDVPLVGTVCIHGFIHDNDFDISQRLLDFSPTDVSVVESTVTSMPNGSATFALIVTISTSKFDTIAEPPTDVTLTDISNNGNGYLPENDLSNYLKAYGKLTVDDAVLTFTGTLPSTETAAGMGYELRLRSVEIGNTRHDFNRGPYCNNNLGTTGTPYAGANHFSDADHLLRPFSLSGSPNFAGLVSDTALVGGPSALYYARDSGPYPHVAENANGGSGAGRDALGIGAAPYEYNIDEGRYSDNPNNCRRPADACTVSLAQAGNDPAFVQDGGPDFNGTSAACEYPNRSNNPDDVTFKISEQITSYIPYTQGDVHDFQYRK